MQMASWGKIAVKALLEFSIKETMEYFLRKYPAWRSTQPRKNSGIFLVWGTGGIQYYQYFTYSPQMNLGVNVNHIEWQELKKDLTRLGGRSRFWRFILIHPGWRSILWRKQRPVSQSVSTTWARTMALSLHGPVLCLWYFDLCLCNQNLFSSL